MPNWVERNYRFVILCISLDPPSQNAGLLFFLGLDYVFSHFSGIILTSNVYFLLYCIFKRNRPQIGVGLVIPSIVSGVMWGVAQSGWFLANFNLSESVSFPIITTVSLKPLLLHFRGYFLWLRLPPTYALTISVLRFIRASAEFLH